ncbi:MAG: CDP-alcohol phosphatidyltransferase family protein [Oscillospiraceae bacterium]|jgi:cardiolipin synthase|nr:CDP-alcohol phosphatidyltransferase family protein [Oscillospiraceae bacterium]MDD3261949.1 CDP-alcohol phosphatidyltransferase family protein [Oscillospiraceae bacterium]
MPSKNKNFNVPNTLTVLRIILVIPFMCYYLNGKIKPAIIVLLIAGLTDALDGFIARRFHQQTELGQLLDPISDKVIQGLVAISLAIRHPVLLPVLLIFVIKEGIMLVGGGVLLKNAKRPCAAKWYGKVATVMFYVAFAVILVVDIINQDKAFFPLIVALLVITAGMMIFALIMYGREFFRILNSTAPEDQLDVKEMMDRKK